MLFLFVSACTAASGSRPAPQPYQRVIIARNTPRANIMYLQLDIAKALHYFEDEKLTPEFRYFDGAPKVAAALEEGRADFSGNSIDHAVSTRNDSRPLKMVASFTDLPAVTLVVRRQLRSQIRRVQDLKGHRIGVSNLGSGTHIIAASILRSVGLPMDSVTFVGIGAGDAMVEAARKGTVDAIITTDPAAIRLLVDGDSSLLLDLVTYEETQRVFQGGYQFTGLLTRADTILNRPDLVQKMVNVVVRANSFIATHSAAEITEALPPSLVQDRYIFVKSIEHTRPSFSEQSLVREKDVQNNISSQRAFGLIGYRQPIDAKNFYDMTFVSRAHITLSRSTGGPMQPAAPRQGKQVTK